MSKSDTKYEARVMKMMFGPVGESDFSRSVTTVEITSEGGGEYINIKQCVEDKEDCIGIMKEEWDGGLKDLIEKMLKQCRG